MDHLQPARPFAGFAKAGDVNADLELRLLLAGKMEEAQRDLPTAIRDTHQQVAAAAINSLGKQHLTADKATLASLQRTYPDELRTDFVAQWQKEQQVLDAVEIQPLEFFGEGRANAVEDG